MASTFCDTQMAHYVLLKASILVLLFFQVPCSAIEAYKTIEKITIVRDNVFPNPGNLAYTWANRLHRVTRGTVVRRELLFEVGDRYDPFLLEESERNLRKLGFLGQVDITPKLTSSGVEIVVHTEDQWTTTVKSYMEMGGDVWWVGGGLSEYNFGGWGYEVILSYHASSTGDHIRTCFKNPRLWGSRWLLEADYHKGTDGSLALIHLERPFYSLDTPWSAVFSLSKNDRIVPHYSGNGDKFMDYRAIQQTGKASFSRSLGIRTEHRVTAALHYRKGEYSLSRRYVIGDPPLRYPVPENEEQALLTGTLNLGNHRYLKARRLDHFGNVEDVAIGTEGSLTLGQTMFQHGSYEKDFYLALELGRTGFRPNGHYVFSQFSARSYTSRRFDKWRDGIAFGRLLYYVAGHSDHTLAANLVGMVQWNCRPVDRLVVGGNNGLRGYPAYELVGNRGVLLNLENRLFSGKQLFTVALGGVIFFDYAYMWDADAEPWRANAGIGLRLGLMKSHRFRVLRLDCAFPVKGNSGYMISLGSGQTFSMGNRFPWFCDPSIYNAQARDRMP